MAHTEQKLENVLYHPHRHVRHDTAGIPVAGEGQREDHWEDIPPPIENIGQAQRPHYLARPHNLFLPPAYPAIPYNRGANDIPPPAENMAIQDQAQRLHNVDEVHYNEIPPVLAHPAVPYDLGVNDYVRPVQDVQGQVFGPLAADIQRNHIFPYAPQHAEAGAYPAFPGDGPYQAPPGARQAEGLRRLASRYLHHPYSQVGMIRMEQDQAGRPRVVIILDMYDFI